MFLRSYHRGHWNDMYTFSYSVPEMLLAKFLRSQFYNLYRRAIVPQFQDKKLSYLLKNGVLSRKPIMFVISAPKTVHESLRSLLNQREIAIKIVSFNYNEELIFYIFGSSHRRQIVQSHIRWKTATHHNNMQKKHLW